MSQSRQTLLVDIGNSMLCWSLGGKYDCVPVESFAADLMPVYERALVSCVAHSRLLPLFNNAIIIKPKPYKNIKFHYDLAELGSDRFLAIVAGFEKYPTQDLMIIDIGTFVTIDCIKNQQHISLGIAPGLKKLKNICNFLGIDSRNAWKIGTEEMFQSYIKNKVQSFKGKILITGGGQDGVKINHAEYQQNLVIQGLEFFHE